MAHFAADVPRGRSIMGTMLHSTTTVGSSIRLPQSFDEKELFPRLEPTREVHRIKCDYGEKVWTDETTAPEELPPKKRAGRKPIVRAPKPRKHPGDGKSFHSQITFHVLGEYERATLEGDEGRNHCSLEDGVTTIAKTYKIKLFRNGNITVPGALTEDMRDVLGPLTTLCRYLMEAKAFTHPTNPLWRPRFTLPKSQMFNYKFRLLKDNINLYRFRDYCETLNKGKIHVSPVDLRKALLRPTLAPSGNAGDAVSPAVCGWRRYFAAKQVRYDGGLLVEIDLPDPAHILTQLVSAKTPKTIICRAQQVTELLATLIGTGLLERYYRQLYHLSYMARALSDTALEHILYCWLHPHLSHILGELTRSDNNFLVSVRYDQDTYAAMILRFRSPDVYEKDPEKCITVKIFPASFDSAEGDEQQKINIDGAKSRREAELVYWWLNHHLAQSGALFERDYYSDDEFSYTASEASSSDSE